MTTTFHPEKHSVMRCTGCGGRQWHIGRLHADCAFCGNVVALAETDSQPMEPRFVVRCSKTAEAK